MQGLHQRLERQFKAASTERSTHEALGMMTAVASIPTPVRPMDWLKELLDVSEFQDQAGAEVFVGEVLHVYNEIVTRLQKDETVGPASADEDVVRQWCEGYIEMATVDPEWESDERGRMILVPFLVLAGAFEPPESADEKDAVERWRHELPDIVRVAYRYWDDAREANGIRLADHGPNAGWDSTYRREQAKVGRNEPCVCGSGKKYKRCCGLQ